MTIRAEAALELPLEAGTLLTDLTNIDFVQRSHCVHLSSGRRAQHVRLHWTEKSVAADNCPSHLGLEECQKLSPSGVRMKMQTKIMANGKRNCNSRSGKNIEAIDEESRHSRGESVLLFWPTVHPEEESNPIGQHSQVQSGSELLRNLARCKNSHENQ